MVSDVYSSGHIIRFHGPLEKGAPYCDTQVDVNLHKATQGDWQFLEGNMSTGTKGRYPDDYFSIKKQGAEIVAIDAKGSPITEEKLDFYTNFVNEAARAYHRSVAVARGLVIVIAKFSIIITFSRNLTTHLYCSTLLQVAILVGVRRRI